MKKLQDLIGEELVRAFAAAGYDEKYAGVTLSNRPDLCDYQCNGALAAAKEYHKAPIMIAQDVAAALADSACFSETTAAKPGFINLKLSGEFLSEYLQNMHEDERYGLEKVANPKTVIVDYGGANVAKPLHVGHLRTAIIGESVKRIGRFMGHEMIGDVHLGDWGLQMGLVITEVKRRQPELVYFDESFEGEYPKEAPFTIGELEEIYPAASARSKEDPAYREEAMEATKRLQQKDPGYYALWEHILRVSMEDLKRNYDNLDVHFELWKKESDVQKYIPDMVQYLKDGGYAHLDEGALVVDVKEESDTKEIPPCMILKSDGASLYNTTDLATLVERRKLYHPDEIVYVVDKRQELYFEQVFRCARKTGLVDENTKLRFLGFGTMNGRDGKPFKTRDGGVMRLEHLIGDICQTMYEKIEGSRLVSLEEAKKTADIVGLAAIKYGDLSNQASKDYVFDVERFTSFEGNTGPYVLYTIVRIRSILNKYEADGGRVDGLKISPFVGESDRALMLELVKFQQVMENAYEELAPHKLCSYIYDIANAFNHFYHETMILGEEDKEKKEGYLALLSLTRDILLTCTTLLGFSAPERM